MRLSTMYPPRLRPSAGWVLVSVFAGVLLAMSLCYWEFGWDLGIDSSVYRSGALAVWQGEPLYGTVFGTPGGPDLPFTYPPMAALLFTPLAVLPVQLAWGVLAAASMFALGAVLWVCLPDRLRRPATGALLACAALLFEPVWRTISYGQVNLVLLALVVLDVLRLRGSRYGGVLIGVAAAVKLTPLIFIVHLALTSRRRDAGRALGVFAGLAALSVLVLPGEVVRYVTAGSLTGGSASGHVWAGWVGNQSVHGLLQRVSGGAGWAFGASVVLGVLVLAGAGWAVRRLHLAARPLPALLATGFCGLLISPISWTHHWVWLIPLSCWLLCTARYLALSGLCVLAAGWTFFLVPDTQRAEIGWTLPEALAGNAYVLGALVVLACCATRALSTVFSLRSSGYQVRLDGSRRT